MTIIRIMSVKPYFVRLSVALIVWWDMYSDVPTDERSEEFDQFLSNPDRFKATQSVSKEELIEALIKVGYDRNKAVTRLVSIDYLERNKQYSINRNETKAKLQEESRGEQGGSHEDIIGSSPCEGELESEGDYNQN